MKSEPNLFRFATSELSQDALLAWLISWADTAFAETSKSRHRIARGFVNWMYQKAGRPIPEFDSVTILRQFNRVDLLVKLTKNEEAKYILIEDKTFTSDHAHQITGYIKAVKESLGTECDLLPVCLKTWVEYPKKDGVTRLFLPDILNFFDDASIEEASSEILTSWVDSMKELYNSLMRFQSMPISEWNDVQWQGCFHYLTMQAGMEELEPGYGYVANASGGFMGCWMGWQSTPEKDYIYLQIDAYPKECYELTFRIVAQTRARVHLDVAKRLFSVMEGVAQEKGISLRRPQRMKSGKSSRFGILNMPVFSETEGGIFDEKIALSQIRTCHEILQETAKRLDDVLSEFIV